MRGGAEGQRDSSGGFKVRDLRHSNDTMAQLVRVYKKEQPHTRTHPIGTAHSQFNRNSTVLRPASTNNNNIITIVEDHC